MKIPANIQAITSFDQLDSNRLYTYADYLMWQFKERVELIKGRILKMLPTPNRRHQELVGDIFFSLKQSTVKPT